MLDYIELYMNIDIIFIVKREIFQTYSATKTPIMADFIFSPRKLGEKMFTIQNSKCRNIN